MGMDCYSVQTMCANKYRFNSLHIQLQLEESTIMKIVLDRSVPTLRKWIWKAHIVDVNVKISSFIVSQSKREYKITDRNDKTWIEN